MGEGKGIGMDEPSNSGKILCHFNLRPLKCGGKAFRIHSHVLLTLCIHTIPVMSVLTEKYRSRPE